MPRALTRSWSTLHDKVLRDCLEDMLGITSRLAQKIIDRLPAAVGSSR